MTASSNSADIVVSSFLSSFKSGDSYFSLSVKSLNNNVPSHFVIKSNDAMPLMFRVDLLLLVPRNDVLTLTVYS